LNPRLYQLGQGANYNKEFHDISDKSTNNETGDTAHFQAVTGYDLATGWGSPRIGLLNDLASPSPSLPPNLYGQVTFTIQVGGDDLRCTSSATADLLDATGSVIHTTELKHQGASSWDNNTTHTVTDSFSPPQTRAGIAAIRINLIQHSDSCQLFGGGSIRAGRKKRGRVGPSRTVAHSM
jgi:hypothetical protein